MKNMERKETNDQLITNVVFEKEQIRDQDHEGCTFKNCNFSGTNLNGSTFTDTIFEGCNFSLASLRNTSFRKVVFTGCKFTGVHFEDCNPFLLEWTFKECNIELSAFCKLNLKGISFEACRLLETDFTAANLSGAVFRDTSLERCIFFNTVLEKTDLTTAQHYSIDPNKNNLRGAKIAYPALLGLLEGHGLDVQS